jgi:hypothetical protein
MAITTDEVIREYRVSVALPVVKTFEEVKEIILNYGKSDFNIDCLHWSGPPAIMTTMVVQIISYGNAARYSDQGYYVFANNIDELGGYLSYIVEYAKSSGIPIIYVRAHVEGLSLVSQADEQVKNWHYGGVDI